MESRIIRQVRSLKPLIHCITNYVTAGDVANMLLAAGGSPIMADGIREVEEITSICRGLVLNLGTLKEWSLDSMLKAGTKAAQLSHPIVLDPVGVGASAFRLEAARRILAEFPCQVICGNASEIKALAKGLDPEEGIDCTPDSVLSGHSGGVDVNREDEVSLDHLDRMCRMVKWLSRRTHAVIAMTGAIDLVGDEKQVYIIGNGHPMMAGITGSGCMLDGVIAAYISANQDRVLEAAALAVAAIGVCGELAHEKVVGQDGGLGSFRVHLIDFMSKLDDRQLNGGVKIEIR